MVLEVNGLSGLNGSLRSLRTFRTLNSLKSLISDLDVGVAGDFALVAAAVDVVADDGLVEDGHVGVA